VSKRRLIVQGVVVEVANRSHRVRQRRQRWLSETSVQNALIIAMRCIGDQSSRAPSTSATRSHTPTP